MNMNMNNSKISIAGIEANRANSIKGENGNNKADHLIKQFEAIKVSLERNAYDTESMPGIKLGNLINDVSIPINFISEIIQNSALESDGDKSYGTKIGYHTTLDARRFLEKFKFLGENIRNNRRCLKNNDDALQYILSTKEKCTFKKKSKEYKNYKNNFKRNIKDTLKETAHFLDKNKNLFVYCQLLIRYMLSIYKFVNESAKESDRKDFNLNQQQIPSFAYYLGKPIAFSKKSRMLFITESELFDNEMLEEWGEKNNHKNNVLDMIKEIIGILKAGKYVKIGYIKTSKSSTAQNKLSRRISQCKEEGYVTKEKAEEAEAKAKKATDSSLEETGKRFALMLYTLNKLIKIHQNLNQGKKDTSGNNSMGKNKEEITTQLSAMKTSMDEEKAKKDASLTEKKAQLTTLTNEALPAAQKALQEAENNLDKVMTNEQQTKPQQNESNNKISTKMRDAYQERSTAEKKVTQLEEKQKSLETEIKSLTTQIDQLEKNIGQLKEIINSIGDNFGFDNQKKLNESKQNIKTQIDDLSRKLAIRINKYKENENYNKIIESCKTNIKVLQNDIDFEAKDMKSISEENYKQLISEFIEENKLFKKGSSNNPRTGNGTNNSRNGNRAASSNTGNGNGNRTGKEAVSKNGGGAVGGGFRSRRTRKNRRVSRLRNRLRKANKSVKRNGRKYKSRRN